MKAAKLILTLFIACSIAGCSTAATQSPFQVATPSSPMGVRGGGLIEATPMPTASPSAIPIPIKEKPTPAPSSAPALAQQAESSAAAIQIISITSPAARNSTATLRVKVSPGATASIRIHYKSGDSKAAGLEDKKADANGNVSWSWHVGGNTTLGSWPITVSSDESTANTEFEVIH